MSKRTEYIILAHRFFRDFTPFAPFLAIYFSRSGLSLSTISFMFVIWALTSITLEIPTGILADKYDRKNILVIAQLTKLLAFSVWLFSPSFITLLAGLILWGIAASLDSGTFQAFLYDLTRVPGGRLNFNYLYGKSNAASFAGLFVATLLAAVLIHQGFQLLLVISTISLAISLAAIIIIPRPIALNRATNQKPTFSYKTLLSGFSYLLKHKTLLLIFIIGVAAAGIKAPLDEYHALFLAGRNAPLFAVGLMIASLELIKSIGAALAAKLRIKDNQQRYLLLGMGILFIVAGATPAYLAFALLALIILLDIILWIANDAAIQHQALDNNRATLASIKMFTSQIVAAVMLTVFTLISATYQISSLYVISGVLLTVIALTFIIPINRSSKIK